MIEKGSGSFSHMANSRFFKWGIGLLSVSMFTYFLGLTQHLAKSNPPIIGTRLVQNNTRSSIKDSIKNEWNASQGQLGSSNTSTQGPNQINNGQGQQNYNDPYNSQTQSANSFIARSQAS